jgi:hypothetical protein
LKSSDILDAGTYEVKITNTLSNLIKPKTTANKDETCVIMISFKDPCELTKINESPIPLAHLKM